ncbi:MAG: ATP-binding cassette domain-containing protein [Dorea sp.]|jgi:ABC-2 type transport system ATP-binding protein|nr:ATP-binding cassette domain-containing protein [Dorea sp.]
MIELQNIEKYYGNKLALDQVSFSIDTGSIVGLLGKNGAGKSTLMNIIAGYMPATKGTVTIDGMVADGSAREVKKKIGYLPEKPPLYEAMSVREYLRYAARIKGIESGKIRKETDLMIEKTGLKAAENRLIRNLSKGYRQRVGIAQAMTGEPMLLILDEPTAGLDPAQVVEVRALLREYGRDHIVIISSHILSEIAEICDRILILNEGKLMKDCRMSELSASDKAHIFIRIDRPKEIFEKLIGTRLSDCVCEYRGMGEQGCSDWEIKAQSAKEDIRSRVFGIIKENNMELLQMFPARDEIEDVFLDLTAVNAKKEEG